MKIYISGPMTGIKDHNKKAFDRVAQYLEKRGDTVLNPHCLPKGLEYHEYMDICMSMVRACEAIYPMNGWEESKGARAEMAYARSIGRLVLG